MLDSKQITQMIEDYRSGSKSALNELFPVIYQQLRRIASREKRRIWDSDTINATALVHEAYIKLVRSSELDVENRAHFFALCAMGMRQIIVNYLEQKQAKKRGGDWQKVTLSDVSIVDHQNLDTVLAVDRALEQLSRLDKKLADLVEMRFYAGMTEAEIALVQNCTERTVRRNWSKAKALLQRIMSDEGPDITRAPPKTTVSG